MDLKGCIESEENAVIERYQLSIGRIKQILGENTVPTPFHDYFVQVAGFINKIDEVLQLLKQSRWDSLNEVEMKAINASLYQDILGDNYQKSYANPKVAAEKLGTQYGSMLSFLYAEIRGEIAYVYEERILYLAICNELFIEIYNCFEGETIPEYKSLEEIVYWYASDYCDVFLADRIQEQLNPEGSFATNIIEESDLSDIRYLYRFGEYISENERGTAIHLMELPEETIQKMADVYTEGYRMGFVNTGKDISKKSVVNIRYVLGFERVIRKAIQNFYVMGLKPTIYRAAVSVITKRQQHKVGYCGGIANKQYEYDHRLDQGLFLDKRYVERKLDITKNVYEKNKGLAEQFAGPAVMEVFGERPFAPVSKAEAIKLDDKQEKLAQLYDNKSSQITNQYIKGEERSFTIVAYPIPEIGADYNEIFDKVIEINTLDAKLYEKVQQIMIDALDQGKYLHIKGGEHNTTDLIVQLYRLNDVTKETIFENCVADVNIPVGEVFTSPVLKGTNGILNVSKVYLNELQYLNLTIEFIDGKITKYSCDNFAQEEENQAYIKENILMNHKSLPLGEFAIGTNTTAYVVAKQYQIEDKMPILIAEKMGPHFAVGDTCYSWSEENQIFNPNGKEIVAKDNECSILRKTDVNNAYYQCHTDITIPYEELKEITVHKEDGSAIDIIRDGRFVLPGTEILNKPLEKLN
ncbi:aminopeptidase [Lachnospiraceae bacterium LCP25S3_G4]